MKETVGNDNVLLLLVFFDTVNIEQHLPCVGKFICTKAVIKAMSSCFRPRSDKHILLKLFFYMCSLDTTQHLVLTKMINSIKLTRHSNSMHFH